LIPVPRKPAPLHAIENPPSTPLPSRWQKNRKPQHWGDGILLEAVGTDHARDAILVVPLNWHPWEWLKLSAAPGVEFVRDGSDEFVVRLGVAYEFELGRWNLAPEISVDFTRESQTCDCGLSLGRNF